MKIEYVVAENKEKAKKETLTYKEFNKVTGKEYDLLNCGHYVPAGILDIKYDHENVICPKCGKATFSMGINTRWDSTEHFLKER